jgi:hypothetical protein
MVSSVLRTDAFAPWPADRVLPVVGTLPPPLSETWAPKPTDDLDNDGQPPVTWQWHTGGNPFTVPTERDRVCEVKRTCVAVKRSLLIRK